MISNGVGSVLRMCSREAALSREKLLREDGGGPVRKGPKEISSLLPGSY
jgi:hypothetical protein